MLLQNAASLHSMKDWNSCMKIHRTTGDHRFPANNFGHQEPGTNSEIQTFCKKNYGVTFQMMSKISVKGEDIDPLFKWLTAEPNPDFTGDIKWNFEKFLLDENGKLIRRFEHKIEPMSDVIS